MGLEVTAVEGQKGCAESRSESREILRQHLREPILARATRELPIVALARSAKQVRNRFCGGSCIASCTPKRRSLIAGNPFSSHAPHVRRAAGSTSWCIPAVRKHRRGPQASVALPATRR